MINEDENAKEREKANKTQESNTPDLNRRITKIELLFANIIGGSVVGGIAIAIVLGYGHFKYIPDKVSDLIDSSINDQEIPKLVENKVIKKINVEIQKIDPKNLVEELNERANQTDEILDKLKQSHERIGKLENELMARLQHFVPSEWEKRDVNTVHQAETNGLVATFSGGKGNNVSAGIILEGRTADLVRGRDERTRFQKYDGSVLPVQKKRYWKVESIWDGNSETITVYWLPLGE